MRDLTRRAYADEFSNAPPSYDTRRDDNGKGDDMPKVLAGITTTPEVERVTLQPALEEEQRTMNDE